VTGALRWDGHDAAALARRWQVPAVHPFLEVGSTNDIALALAKDGAPHGTVVLAEAQTSGRGRSGRPWDSPAGSGIWLSIVLRPGGGSATAAPLQVGRIVAGAITRQHPAARPRLKWPNDVLIGGRKVAGILCESTGGSGGVEVLVAGVGINTDHRAGAALAPGLQDTATFISLATGGPVNREALAATIAGEVVALHADRLASLGEEELAELQALDALRGSWVRVSLDGAPAEATALGIDRGGALRVRDADGRERRVVAGSVRLMEAARAVGAVGESR
jgi:BirA family transcriptional regulator, biotin operon repressor / biotin---[acetyl-CoA-carboxylase] ligase